MRSLGISIQPDSFSFALCDGSLKKYTLAAAGSQHLENLSGDLTKDLGRMIAAAIKAGGASKFDKLVVSAPSVDAALREHSLPFVEREKVMQVLKFEVESELYHLDIDDVICDFIEMQDDRATSTLLVAAEPKTSIQTCLDILAEAGLDAPQLDLDYGGLSAIQELLPNIAASAGQTSEADSDEEAEAPARSNSEAAADADALKALLWVGPYSSILMVYTGRGLRTSRTLHIGYRELAGELALDGAESQSSHAENLPDGGQEADQHAADSAEAAANEAMEELMDEDSEEESHSVEMLFGVGSKGLVNLPLAELLEKASPAIAAAFRMRLVAEVRRGLLASSLQPVSLTLLGAEIPGLDEQLQQRLGFPVGTHQMENSACPIAFGLSLKGLGSKSSPMNFLQEEFRFTKGLERIQGPITFALTCLLFYFVLNGVVNFKRGHALMTAAAGLEEGRSSLLKIVSSDVDKMLNEKLHENAPPEWRVTVSYEGVDIPREQHIQRIHGNVKKASSQLDDLFGTGTLEMPQSCLNAWNLVFGVLEREFDDKGFRWMLESLSLESKDEKSKQEAHVECKLQITILDEQVSSATRRGELLERAFREKDWVIAPPTNIGWGPPDEAVGRTTTITLLISTEKARRAEDQS